MFGRAIGFLTGLDWPKTGSLVLHLGLVAAAIFGLKWSIQTIYKSGVTHGRVEARAEFAEAQAEADAAQYQFNEELDAALDHSSREIEDAYQTRRDAIADRANALRVRAEGPRNSGGSVDQSVSDFPAATCVIDAAAEGDGLSRPDTITALEQADLNTEQLLALQEWVAATTRQFNGSIEAGAITVQRP